MTTGKAESWALEIRDFLLGRLSTRPRQVSLPAAQRLPAAHAPIRRWWIFEGKRFPVLGGNLASNWDRAIRLARALDRTCNPRLRLSDRADGLVDWPATLARGVMQAPRSYVVQASGVGLGEDERSALRGWISWVASEWSPYAQHHGLPDPLDWGSLYDNREPPTQQQLRRWLHVSRRSRWPLLRQVVAETLRPVLEPSDLDRIPLPSDPAHLFELLCLVRIARMVGQPPEDLRWLDPGMGHNTLKLDGATLWYQQTIAREAVLATPCYSGGLSTAVEVFELGLSRFIDLAVEFSEPRNGFDGIIVEVKSGMQQFEDALPQLQTYRAARPRRVDSRYICWGIVENPKSPTLTATAAAYLRDRATAGGDLWVFSGPDAIPDVLRTSSVTSPAAV